MFYLFHLFRSFLPLHNPIGFGPGDFIELTLAAVLVCLALIRTEWTSQLRRLASHTRVCMLLLFILPIALRLLLLPEYPVPAPDGADDFSYLLLADTLAHFRLANPPHALSQFFETAFVLQQPAYSSIYPIGPAIALAIGELVFRNPWAGVALAIGAFCALCYWMLRGWTTPLWSLIGGVLAALEFGPLNQWMNTYWGGAVAATAGCLVFGALPRLRDRGQIRYAILLGAGLGLHLLTRPYESIFLLLSVILFFVPDFTTNRSLTVTVPLAFGTARVSKRFSRFLRWNNRFVVWTMAAALAAAPALGLVLLQNKQVTGNWTTLPYMLSRDQYGVPTTFTFQSNPVPHRQLTRQQKIYYEGQALVHGTNHESVKAYLERLAGRARFYRFFFLAPLYLALPAFLLTIREYRFFWILVTVTLFALGSNFYPYFFSHYIAALTCVFILIGVIALQTVGRIEIRGYTAGANAAAVIVFLCVAQFVFWYGLHLFGNREFATTMTQYETWDAINQDDPASRTAIADQLARIPGKHLVFVRYSPQHVLNEWVYNSADIDASRIVWARDLGAAENEALRRYYPGRSDWLVEPDARPPRLIPYAQIGKAESVQPPPPRPSESHPQLKLEDVH